MNRLAIIADFLRLISRYANVFDDRTALELLADLRSVIARAENMHRRPRIVDLGDDEGL